MRQSNPLAFYALLEGLIAITVGLSPWLIDASRAVYIGLRRADGPWRVGATTVRLVLSAFILLAPTLLMGGTLPAAVAAVTTPEDENRRAVAILYGVNTIGAVGRSDGQHVSHAAGARHAVYALVRLHGERRRMHLCLVLVAASSW